MIETALTSVLAQLPEASGYYFHPAKIIFFALAMYTWWYAAAWIDKDVIKVRSSRAQWHGIVFGAGLLGAFLWIVMPVSAWIGLLIFLVVYGAALGTYVVFRNGRVSPSQTVLTPAHFKRLIERKAETDEAIHERDRVRIKGADGTFPKWPTDPVQHEAYQGLQDLLFDALWRRASDVDISLQGQQPARVLYKVDGVVRERDPLPRPQADLILQHFKRIAGMDPEEVRRPQEGKLTGTIGAGGTGDKTVEVVLKSVGSTAGQRLTLRVFAAESRFRVNELGFTKAQATVLEPLIEKLDGLIICSGPKESGVSSMLYAMLRSHDAFMRNIHTLETAKLLDVENVTQHVHDPRGGQVSYSRALQSILRADPDIVMVGECPDSETAVLCADYAQQKKMYLAISANDAFEALRKFLQAVGDNPLAAKGLLAIISGRLIRKLCTNCRKGYRPDPSLLEKANLPKDQNRPFYRPPNRDEVEMDKQGNPIVCPVCQGSGYHGRTGIYEALVIDDVIRGLIAQGAPLTAIRAQARKNKMFMLQEIGLQKVYEGITSINEVLRVTKEESGAAASPAKVTT